MDTSVEARPGPAAWAAVLACTLPEALDAVRMLAGILQRMQAHQSKKRSLLRALAAWQPPSGEAGRPAAAGTRPSRRESSSGARRRAAR